MSDIIQYEGEELVASPAAPFTHNGCEYEARLVRVCRGMAGAYLYNKTSDLEAMVSREDMYCVSLLVEMPYGERFEISAHLGDWLEHAPRVVALGLSKVVA